MMAIVVEVEAMAVEAVVEEVVHLSSLEILKLYNILFTKFFINWSDSQRFRDYRE